MYEEQLFARVSSCCLLSRGPSLGSRNRGEVGRHFRPLGRPAPLGLEAELCLQCVPESPHFLRENNSMKSTLRPRSFGSGGGVRFSSNRSCLSRLRGGPRARPSRPKKRPDSGGGGRSPEPGVRPRGGEERPPPNWGAGLRGSAGRARGHRGVTGLPRGLCSALLPHCALPSSPRPVPPQVSASALFVFPAPRPPPGHANSPQGCVIDLRPWP